MLLSLLYACEATIPNPEGAAPDKVGEGPATTAAVLAPTPVKLALNWYAEPEFGGYYEAKRSGAYARAGLDVELIPGGPGTPVLQMLASGAARVAISGADDLLLQHAQGFAGVAIFAGFQDSPVGLLVHDPGPATWADVTGKVAMEDGSPFQRFLWSKMGWEGKVARVPTTGGLGAFATDETLSQQAYVTSEPCVAEAKGIAARFLPARDIGWNPYASLAVVKTEDSGAEWAKAFVAASREGWEAYLKEPSAANLEIAKINPEMTVEAMRCISERQAPFVRGAGVVGQVEPARMVEVAAALSAATGQVVSAEGVTAAVKVEVDRTIIRGDGVLGGAAERVERDEERDRAR